LVQDVFAAWAWPHCRFHGKSPFWLAVGAGHIAKGLSRHDRAESGLMSRLSRHAMGWKR
jgi:hypothetical protein